MRITFDVWGRDWFEMRTKAADTIRELGLEPALMNIDLDAEPIGYTADGAMRSWRASVTVTPGRTT